MAPISAERWRTLSPYLDEALEISGAARADWLAAIAAHDASLAADLRMLLAEHETVHETHFLESPVPLVDHTAFGQSLEGQIVGAYRLVSPIGQGGMGSVWLAERCDGRFEGRAAIKLLNIALVGRAGEERFRHEGTILARLTHPNIARLIDAGVSPSGQPFLVLEHVDGQHIDRYCHEQALTIECRLRLFLHVLDAVAHAHANLIVHRDIKPPNVLVGAGGRVKLLDFGIAKLIEGDWTDGQGGMAGALTRDGGLALTPEFAAPEQLAGGRVTTATDVYGLGVLLYVLLSGQHPAGAAVRSPATLVRAIVEAEPRRVSDAVVGQSEPPEALAEHAARCGLTPARLRRVLRGDLDIIVAKALKKDAAERYVSVTALAEDVRRYLRHQPIGARPDSVRYRAARFVRRHARGVAVTTGFVLLLGGSTAYYTNRLAAERDRAQREAVKAAKVSELLTGVLTAADPYSIRGTEGEPTVRGLLDAGADRVLEGLNAEQEVQAEILTVMGRIYRRLGAYEKAQPLLERALASGTAAFGPEHIQVASTLNDLGVLMAERGEYDAAGRYLSQALDMRRRLLGNEHEDVAVTLVELGRVYQDQGFNERAEPLQREALRVRRLVLGDDHREVAVSLSDVASVLRLSGDFRAAEPFLRQSLELNRRTRGADHPNTSMALHDLALITAAGGDYAAAEEQFRLVLARQRAALGERHPVVAVTLSNLSRVLLLQGRVGEAVSALEEALAVARPALGGRHQLVAIYTIDLGALHLARRDPARAEALLREGLRIRLLAPGVVPARRRTFPEYDWSVSATRGLLGAALTAQGRYDDAEAVLLEARRDLEAAPRRSARDAAATDARLAELYDAWGKPDRAAVYRALAR